MATAPKEYQKMAQKASPPSPKWKDACKAFLVGGSICTFAQGLLTLYQSYFDATETGAKTAVSVTLIFLTAFLTGIGVFDRIAKHAGAGTIVPITGFANAVVSPAMEFQAEGRILGTGAKLFSIAGPVIVYGCAAASVYGIFIYLFAL